MEQTSNSEIQAHFAEVKHHTLKGLDPRINLDKPPRNFKAAMAAIDNQAWAAAYNLEYIGFKKRGVFKVVKPEILLPDSNIRRITVNLSSVRHVYAQ